MGSYPTEVKRQKEKEVHLTFLRILGKYNIESIIDTNLKKGGGAIERNGAGRMGSRYERLRPGSIFGKFNNNKKRES